MARGKLCKTAIILSLALVGGTARSALAAPDCVHWLAEGFWRMAVAADIGRCLAAGARLDARNRNGEGPLHLAAEFGDAATVGALIAAGAAVGVRGERGMTPLHIAVVDRQFVQILLERWSSGARPAAPQRRSVSATWQAAIEDRVAKVKALIAAGADVEARSGERGKTPLHLAAGSSDAKTINALIKGGARLEIRDKHGLTPLHDASLWNPEAVHALLDAGADGAATTPDGLTPFHLADREMPGTDAWRRLRAARSR